MDLSRNLLALLEPRTISCFLYDISILEPHPAGHHQEPFLGRANGNGVGAVLLRNGKLFALESNNGLLAFSLGQTNLPATITIQPASISLWEGATYKLTAVLWRHAVRFRTSGGLPGTNIPGATQASLTLTNISFTKQGVIASRSATRWAAPSAPTQPLPLLRGMLRHR